MPISGRCTAVANSAAETHRASIRLIAANPNLQSRLPFNGRPKRRDMPIPVRLDPRTEAPRRGDATPNCTPLYSQCGGGCNRPAYNEPKCALKGGMTHDQRT